MSYANLLVTALVAGTAAATSATSPHPSVRHYTSTANVPPHLHAGSVTWPPPPPYDAMVKDLGAQPTAAACEAACVAFVNTTASPVSGWTRCKSYTWLAPKVRAAGGGGGSCIGVVDELEWHPVAQDGATTGRLTWPPRPCETDADCSYNGKCGSSSTSGSGKGSSSTSRSTSSSTTSPLPRYCSCDLAWKGDRCQTLALLPTTPRAGLRATDPSSGENTSTWGGGVLLDEKTGVYHMYEDNGISGISGISCTRCTSCSVVCCAVLCCDVLVTKYAAAGPRVSA